MSKFFIFFLLSFTLHLALGGVLLYRSGLLGKSSQVEVETTSMEEGEGISSLGDKERDKESQLVMEEPPPPPVETPVKKKKKKAPKKVKKISKKKPKKEKPKPKKFVPPPPVVEKPVPEPAVEEPKPVPEPAAALAPVAPKAEPEEPPPPPVIEKPVEESSKPAPELVPATEPVEEALTSEPASVPPIKNSGENKNSVIKNSASQAGTTPETARVFDQLKQIPGNPMPEYPKEALEQKWEGAVEVLYYVSTGGFVEQIQVGRSSGHIVLDNAAIKALSRYRYELGQEGWVRHRVEFFLEKDKEIKEIVPLRTMEDK